MTGDLPEGDLLLLIDASSFFHRAFHVATRTIRRGDHLETGAIIAFCWTMMKLFHTNRTAIGRLPTHAAVVMDSRGKNFRHEIFPGYKSNRAPYDPGLEMQLPYIPDIADAFNVPCIKIAGWEADDIIATYADMAERAGLTTVIASSDKDLMQLVGGRCFMYDAMKDKSRDPAENRAAMIDIDAVIEKWGVFPWEMMDLQALMGDAVDNIPGVPKVGPKGAAALVKQFHNVDNLISSVTFGPEDFTDLKLYGRLLEHVDSIEVSRRLVELARDVPVSIDLDGLRLRPPSRVMMREFFLAMEAPQLAARI